MTDEHKNTGRRAVVSIDSTWRQRGSILTLLDPEEKLTFARLRVAKRRKDWIAGRLAAKRAVGQTLGIAIRRVQVRTVAEGVQRGLPYALVDGRRRGYLSIAHASDLATALFDPERRCGIDVETVSDRPELETLAFTAEERALFSGLRGATRQRRVTELWCKKEALSKWQGTGFRASFATLDVLRSPFQTTFFTHRGQQMACAWIQR